MSSAYYLPEYMSQLARKLSDQKEKQSSVQIGYTDRRFKGWICRLSSLPESKIRSLMQFLSDIEVSRIAAYIPYNYYRVKCNNLYMIVREKATPYDWILMYRGWQDRYRNSKLSTFLSEELNKNAEILPDEEKRTQIKSVLKSDFGIQIMKRSKQLQNEEDLKLLLRSYDIRENSVLFRECVRNYFFVCSENTYQQKGDDELRQFFLSCTTREQTVFILNLLQKCKVKTLSRFRELYTEIEKIYGGVTLSLDLGANVKWENSQKKYAEWQKVMNESQ